MNFFLSTHSGQFLDVFVAGAKRSQSDFLRELCECWVGKERDVSDELVTDVRLRCVEGPGRVADVLSRVENSEGQAGQEVPGG